MQGIGAQIRAQYSQGSAFLPRDVRFFPDLTPKPPSCGSSHTQCVAKTSLCGVRTLVRTQKMEGINKASKSMTVSGSHHPSHKKRSQEWSGWTAYFLLSHRQDNYILSHATCWLPAGCPASESTTPLLFSGRANSAIADKLKAFQALV